MPVSTRLASKTTMWEAHRCLGIIPARGGSKGIPRKNLRQVGGRSLIGWAASTVASLPWLDAAVLSTDDEEIAAEGRAFGLDVPFMRPHELANDQASGVSAWQHAWKAAEDHYGKRFELSILLQPTTPLRRRADVEATLSALTEGDYRAATTVAPVPGHFAYQKQMKIGKDGSLQPLVGQTVQSNRHNSVASYYRTGACYAAWRQTVVEKGLLMEEGCAAVLIEPFTPNIDNVYELLLADAMVRAGWSSEDGDPTEVRSRA